MSIEYIKYLNIIPYFSAFVKYLNIAEKTPFFRLTVS